jgi:hypothetical protein
VARGFIFPHLAFIPGSIRSASALAVLGFSPLPNSTQTCRRWCRIQSRRASRGSSASSGLGAKHGIRTNLVGEWHGRSRLHLQRRCHEQSGASGANHRSAPLKYETITQPLLERVRQFCQNQWPYGKPDEQCDITSVFLIHLFGGVLQGGFNYEGAKKSPAGAGTGTREECGSCIIGRNSAGA